MAFSNTRSNNGDAVTSVTVDEATNTIYVGDDSNQFDATVRVTVFNGSNNYAFVGPGDDVGNAVAIQADGKILGPGRSVCEDYFHRPAQLRQPYHSGWAFPSGCSEITWFLSSTAFTLLTTVSPAAAGNWGIDLGLPSAPHFYELTSP